MGQKIEIEQSFADRVVAYLNPAKGLERLNAKAKMAFLDGGNSGHKGASREHRGMRNWSTSETSANQANTHSLKLLRSRSRDLVRNTPLALGAISSVVTNVVGEGLVLKSQVDREVLGITPEAADQWQLKAQREFALWAKRADFTDRLNFDEMQALALRSVLESGDLLVVRRRRIEGQDVYGLKLQFIEAERLSNPNFGFNRATMVDGVVLDGDGRPTAYSICSVHPGDMVIGKNRSWKTYLKGSTVGGSPLILHLFDQRRVDQARGVPYLSPVIDSIKELSSYTESEIRAAVISSMFTVFVTKPIVEDGTESPLVGSNTEDNIDSNTELTLAPGAVLDLATGEDVKFADPKRPNVAAQVFIESMAKQIGVALELPVEILLKSFTASYSASRAALEMAWQFFRHRRSWLAWKFCQPVYEWVMTEAIIMGRLSAPGFFEDPIIREAWLGSEWIGQSRIQLDPLKEANADLVDLNMGTTTREEIMMRRTGGSFAAKHAQLVKEETARQEAGFITPNSLSTALQMKDQSQSAAPQDNTQ